jgi:hypothetical protein
MSAVEIQKVRDLISRFSNFPVPFGDKTNWEKFGKLFISCHILIDIISKSSEYQKKILDGILCGVCQVEIWNTMFSLLDSSGNAGLGRAIKALCDGNMEVYGYSEITFDNLEKQITDFVNNAAKDTNNPIHHNSFNIYNYKVNLVLIDSQTQSFSVSVTLSQTPSDSKFNDLIALGINVPNTTMTTTHNIEHDEELDAAVIQLLKDELRENDIEYDDSFEENDDDNDKL